MMFAEYHFLLYENIQKQFRVFLIYVSELFNNFNFETISGQNVPEIQMFFFRFHLLLCIVWNPENFVWISDI